MMSDSRPTVKIRFQNGVTFERDLSAILGDLQSEYIFIKSENPDIIIFGPYGIDFPEPGKYVRVGYFCECIQPDLSLCEYAFGIPREEAISSHRYHRIQWHGLSPKDLSRSLTENQIDRIINTKRKFCNFLYSNRIPYRELFFKKLSQYRKVDAPGKSMTNMASIDSRYTGTVWERKRKFLSEYKFTIAFENYAFPGYQTEKLYDPLQVHSVPIYFGDPLIHEVFNPKSFIDARQFYRPKNSQFMKALEYHCLARPRCEWSPSCNTRLDMKILRKVKTAGRHLKMRIETDNHNFNALIDRITEIDRDDTLYAEYLRQPILKSAMPDKSAASFWRSIINNSLTRN